MIFLFFFHVFVFSLISFFYLFVWLLVCSFIFIVSSYAYISCVLYTKEQLVALNALNLRITCSFSLNNSYCPESHHWPPKSAKWQKITGHYSRKFKYTCKPKTFLQDYDFCKKENCAKDQGCAVLKVVSSAEEKAKTYSTISVDNHLTTMVRLRSYYAWMLTNCRLSRWSHLPLFRWHAATKLLAA